MSVAAEIVEQVHYRRDEEHLHGVREQVNEILVLEVIGLVLEVSGLW